MTWVVSLWVKYGYPSYNNYFFFMRTYLPHRHWMVPNIKSQCMTASTPVVIEEIVIDFRMLFQ